MKNTRRWTFGGVHPHAWSESHPDDRSVMQAQVLVLGSRPAVDVSVRFLHIVRRQIISEGEPVDELVVDGERHISWEEATERELGPGQIAIAGGREEEPLGPTGSVVRTWLMIDGAVDVSSEPGSGGDDLPPPTVRLSNTTPFSRPR